MGEGPATGAKPAGEDDGDEVRERHYKLVKEYGGNEGKYHDGRAQELGEGKVEQGDRDAYMQEIEVEKGVMYYLKEAELVEQEEYDDY